MHTKYNWHVDLWLELRQPSFFYSSVNSFIDIINFFGQYWTSIILYVLASDGKLKKRFLTYNRLILFLDILWKFDKVMFLCPFKHCWYVITNYCYNWINIIMNNDTKDIQSANKRLRLDKWHHSTISRYSADISRYWALTLFLNVYYIKAKVH